MQGSVRVAARLRSFGRAFLERRLDRALTVFTDTHTSEHAVLAALPAFAGRWLPGCQLTVLPAGQAEPSKTVGFEPCFTLPAWNGDPHRIVAHPRPRPGTPLATRHERRLALIERRLTRHLRSLRDEAAAEPHDAWQRLRQAEKRIETAGSVPQLKNAIARYARAACLADAAVVLIKQDQRLLRAAHVGQLHGHNSLMTPSGLPFSGPLKDAWQSGRNAYWTRGQNAPPPDGLPDVQAYAALPLSYETSEMEALVLVLFDRHAHVWTTEETRRLHAASKIAEVMMERLLLKHRNEALSSLVQRLGAAEDPTSVASELEASLRAFRPETGTLTVWWRDGDRYTREWGQGDTQAGSAHTAADLAARYGVQEAAWHDPTVTVSENEQHRTVLLPITFGGQTPAVAVLEERTLGAKLDRGSLAVLEAYAQQAGLLLMQHARGSQWQELAQRDALTGLPNRLAFDRALGDAVRRATFAGAPLTLLLMDINRFKQVNDTLGHAAGDGLLQAAAPALQGALGGDGTLYRWAGDEFAALLPGMTRASAQAVAERLKGAFAPLAPLPGVGLAAGAACMPEVPAGELLLVADKALYADKPARNP